MSYKKISTKLKKIEKDFYEALKDFQEDRIFKKNTSLYLKEDKERIYKKWKKISSLFRELKFIINSNWFNYFLKRDYNSFIIKYYSVILYYNMTLLLQETFKEHEKFLRQYLDENYKENYSTMSRFIYRSNFLYYLNYPKNFIRLFENRIDKDLKWMVHKKVNYNIKFDFNYKNFYYFFKFRFDKILYFFVKYIWIFLSKIRFKLSSKWLISNETIEKFYLEVMPWDILLSRKIFVATNISIPGFWKHMAMYLWTWDYLQKKFKNYNLNYLKKNTHYIIESTSAWVKIVPFGEYISKIDFLWVFRTTFSDKKITNAIKETLNLLNHKYDYLFNFYSDQNFVCSELIIKAYLKNNEDDEWLIIELLKISYWIWYPPDELVKKAEKEKNNQKKEIYPAIFLDTIIKDKKSFINSNEELLKSYKRSKFSFFLK